MNKEEKNKEDMNKLYLELEEKVNKLEDKEKLIKNKELEKEKFFNEYIKNKKLEEEEKEKLKEKLNSILYSYAFNEKNNNKLYYHFTFNKNGSRTIHFNKAIKDILIKEYGVTSKDITTSYNEYSNALKFYSVLSICNDKNAYHNIEKEQNA